MEESIIIKAGAPFSAFVFGQAAGKFAGESAEFRSFWLAPIVLPKHQNTAERCSESGNFYTLQRPTNNVRYEEVRQL